MPTLRDAYPYYLANDAVHANQELEVIDKYEQSIAARVALADERAFETAIAAADAARESMARWPAFRRREVLEHCVARFRERFEEFAYALCVEAGKPIRDSRGEVTRLIETFRIAAGEAERMVGEVMPLDNAPRSQGYEGFWKRVPIGPCAFISPFNFPLNLAAHKVAPAIAAGCPFVLKPASLTPIGALLIGEVLAETDLPKGAFSILPAKRGGADAMIEDPRIKLLSFTGSDSVGWKLKAQAGPKPSVMELGGNAACIVDSDWDLDDAVGRIVFGAYYQSGQSCISVQRLLVQTDAYDAFKERFVAAVRALKSGDPKNEETFIGPMISEKEATRLKGWIDEAVAAGGKLLAGGTLHKRNILEATIIEDAPADAKLVTEEAFGPAVVLSRYDDFDDALAEVNRSRYGLQAGVFTRDWIKAHKAWDRLDVGGVIIGDVPSWRVDHMPYGGVKDSGLGREGVRFAIEDMTEIRLMAMRRPDLQP